MCCTKRCRPHFQRRRVASFEVHIMHPVTSNLRDKCAGIWTVDCLLQLLRICRSKTGLSRDSEELHCRGFVFGQWVSRGRKFISRDGGAVDFDQCEAVRRNVGPAMFAWQTVFETVVTAMNLLLYILWPPWFKSKSRLVFKHSKTVLWWKRARQDVVGRRGLWGSLESHRLQHYLLKCELNANFNTSSNISVRFFQVLLHWILRLSHTKSIS